MDITINPQQYYATHETPIYSQEEKNKLLKYITKVG